MPLVKSLNASICKKYGNFNDILEIMMWYSLQTPRNSCRNTDICAMVYHTYGLRIRFSLRLRHLSCLVTRKCNYDNYRLRKKLVKLNPAKGTYISFLIFRLREAACSRSGAIMGFH